MTRHTLSAFSMATVWASASCTSRIRSRKGVGSAFFGFAQVRRLHCECAGLSRLSEQKERRMKRRGYFPGCGTGRTRTGDLRLMVFFH